MPAANTDLLKKLSRRWVGQIGAGGVADGTTTTISLSSTTNLPTDTAVVVAIDRVDANGTATASLEETIIGVVSGSNLVSCARGAEGTAQAHVAGSVVEVLVTAKGWNDLVDMLLVQHSQLGYHTNITACNITASGILSASHVTASDIVARSIGTVVVSGSLPFVTAYHQAFQTYTPAGAGTATLDLSLGNHHRITMPAGNITIALVNATVGEKFLIDITQDSVGSRTVTWFTTIKWAGGAAPTLTTTANKRDTFGFIVTGSGTYDGFVVGANI